MRAKRSPGLGSNGPGQIAATLVAALLTVLLVTSSSNLTHPLPVARAPSTAPPSDAAWPAYQGGTLHGVLPGGGAFSGARQERWHSTALDGGVWAAPILAGGLVIVSTENDTVYAFPETGSANWTPTWTRHLGSPVPSSELLCGDILPVSGITSTPVADPATDRLYVAAFLQPGRHVLFTLDLRTGKVLAQQTVDPPGESPLLEQQRGALKLANGYVYVPFGGLAGDCGTYHGWLVGASTRGGPTVTFRPPICANQCAFWAPGGVTIGPDGDVWVASGNSESDKDPPVFDYSNTVFRLTPNLKLLDWFAPGNWKALTISDHDLGSIAPVLLKHGLVFMAGKQGVAYLLRQNDLGKISQGAAFAQACPAYAAAVAVGEMVYISCWYPNKVLALRVDAAVPSLTSGWTQAVELPGGLIFAYGGIWVISSSTSHGSLEALDPGTGAVRFRISGGATSHFATPAAGDGHVYAVMGQRLVAVTA